MKLIDGDLDTFEIPIDAYHAKAEFSGMAGNASAQVQGVSVAAKMSGGEQPEPRITITLEAFPEALLLTWLAASMKEHVEVKLLALQGDLLASVTNPATGEVSPLLIAKKQIEIAGTAKPDQKPAAKKRKGKR